MSQYVLIKRVLIAISSSLLRNYLFKKGLSTFTGALKRI